MYSIRKVRSFRFVFSITVMAIMVAAAPTMHAQDTITNRYFGHVPIGAGWNLVFNIVNTGATTVNGTLSILGADVSPLFITINMAPGATFTVDPMPPGSVRTLTVNPVNAADPLKVGWARLETIGGNVTVSATYQLTKSGVLSTAATVLSSQPMTAATIPVDNDLAGRRFLGFAIANPSNENLAIRLTTVNENGTLADGPLTPSQLIIPANGQTAIFLHEILPSRTTFRGSIVLDPIKGEFVTVGLVQNGPLITAVPVIPGKGPIGLSGQLKL